MSDFSFSYSIGSAPALTGESVPLWSFNSTKVLPCIGSTVTLHNSRNNQSMLVQSEVAHALSFCGPFRTMDAHLESILAAMPPLRDNPEDARKILTSIREAGFLEPAEAAWQRLCVDVTPQNRLPRASLFSPVTARKRSSDCWAIFVIIRLTPSSRACGS